LFPNIPVCTPSSTSKEWHNNSIYHLLILGYFWINPSFWCNNSLQHVVTPPWFSSAVAPGYCSAKTIGAHFIVTSAMSQLFSPQQKSYTYTLQAAASSMHIRDSAISSNTHRKNADLPISQYCTQYSTVIDHTD
jgi:hypothetical protein